VFPHLELLSSKPRRKALIFSERVSVGNFIGLWPSPKVVDSWITEHWDPKYNGQETTFSFCQGFYIFLFLNKDE
jgi:hypothetical protein